MHPPTPFVEVICSGSVPALEVHRVAGAVGRVMTRRGVGGHATVRLTAVSGADGPLLVQVNLFLGCRPARMQTITPGHSVVLPAVQRLDRQIERLSAGLLAPWPDPTRRAPDAHGDGVISRRKGYAPLICTPSEAAAVLDAMDYEAHLFTDIETGEDAIVYRAGPAGVRLARQHRRHPPATPVVPLTVHPHPVPILDEIDAGRRLCTHGLLFLFFTDKTTGRGHLLYRRHDGNLGLIIPLLNTETKGR